MKKEDVERIFELKINALFYTAEIYYKTDSSDKSIEIYKAISEEKSVLREEALLKLLEIFIKENKSLDAEAIITENDQYLIKSIYKDRYLLLKSKILYLNGKYNDSLKTLSEVKDKNSNVVNLTNLAVNNYLKLDNYVEAIKTLNEASIFYPHDEKSNLYLNMMNLYFNLGRYVEVVFEYPKVSTYSKSLSENEKNILRLKADYLASLSYMETKEYDKGIVILKTLLSSDSKKFTGENLQIFYKSFYYIGWLYYKQSNYIDAAKNFGTSSLLDINDIDIIKDSYYMEAASHFSRRDYNTALQKYETIYKKFYPSDLGVKAFYQSGKCYENLGNRDKALIVYKKIYDEFPESEWRLFSLYELILDKLTKKNLDEANFLIKIFSEKYSENSLYKSILLLQAESFLANDRLSEAVSVYNFYLKKYPESDNLDTIYYWLCYSSFKTKDFETSKDCAQILISRYKDSSFFKDSLIILKNIYGEEKNYEKEKETLLKIIPETKENSEKLSYEKRINEINLILSGADEEEAKLILNAKKGDPESNLELGIFYLQGRDKVKGLSIVKEIAEKNSDAVGARANNVLGDIENNDANYLEAQKIFLKTLSSYKADSDTMSEALYKSGFVLYKQGKESQAKKIFEKLKSNFPNSLWTEKAIILEKRFKE